MARGIGTPESFVVASCAAVSPESRGLLRTARSAVWAPCWWASMIAPRAAFGRTTLEALGLTA